MNHSSLVNLKSSILLWLPVLIWAGFIFYLSSVPHLRFVQSWWDWPIRKAGHMAVFGFLARLIARALSGSTYWSWKKIFGVALVSTALYAMTDEWHQHFVEGRHASPVDVGIDSLGAWLALGLRP
jgi:VanZ family protein